MAAPNFQKKQSKQGGQAARKGQSLKLRKETKRACPNGPAEGNVYKGEKKRKNASDKMVEGRDALLLCNL